MSEETFPDKQSRNERTGRQRPSWIEILLLAIVALCWLLLSFDLTRHYSPTIDEVPHAASGWAIRTAEDYRVNPEHPPLWKILSALPQSAEALPREFESRAWTSMTSSFILEWVWAADLLYESDPARGVRYIQQARLPVVLLGFLLGAVIVAWSARLGGPFAAVLAATLFLLEPNLLAHSSLVTSDIPFTAALFLTLFLLVRCEPERRPYLTAMAVGIALGFCLAMKFTALLLPPVVAALFLVRPFTRTSRTPPRPPRLRMLELLLVALVSYATLWAVYGFRFSPTPDGQHLDVSHAVSYLEHKASESGSEADGPVVRFALLAEQYRLLPQAYCVGLIWAKATTLGQPAFLLGEISSAGWWYYFPLAVLVKLPTVLILALLGALLLRLRTDRATAIGSWDRVVLLLMPLIILIAAMGSGLNIGLRHVLPVIPALIVLASVIIAAATRTHRSRAATLSIILLLGGADLLLIHPHELSYFNLYSGGSSRGIRILGDSNLDWGQDLGALGRWSAEHPCTTIHLAYYGSTPPEAYGVSYEPLPVREGAAALPRLQTDEDEVLIVSSRYLQGLELHPELKPFYELLRDTEPTDVIGTTLYVYRIGPQASCAGG